MLRLVFRRLSTTVLFTILAIAYVTAVRAQSVDVGASEIGGVVTSAKGPEAGVWVIAETTDLPTKFTRIVVTDDQGRYLIPDLPTANYSVWVRGYGLVDSPKLRAKPGSTLNLAAVIAPNDVAAAHYYPAAYWYAMLKIPPASDFGGSTDIPKNITQDNWLRQMNNVDCIGCHQLGQEATRTIPAALGKFDSGAEAWQRRTQSGQSGEQMTNRIAGQFGGVPYKYFGDWTDRVAKGELPKNKPSRPKAKSAMSWSHRGSGPRPTNICMTSSPPIAVIRRSTPTGRCTVRRNIQRTTCRSSIRRRTKCRSSRCPCAIRNACVAGPGHAATVKPLQPSAYWGERQIWDTRANNHNSMFDKQGRVWLTASVRGMDNPAFCKKGSDNPYAKVFPLEKVPTPGGDARSQDNEVHLRRHLFCDPSPAVRV